MDGRLTIQTILISLCILLYTTAYCREPLRIAYPVFAPFHYESDVGKTEGLFYDIITEAIEKRMGIPLIWTAYPWARCQDNVRFGTDDALVTVPTAERAKYTKTHSKPFYKKTLHLFTFSRNPLLAEIRTIRNLSDIKHRDLSVITYSGNGWNKKYVQSLDIKTYETGSLESVWKMLALKRGDLVIEWPAAAWPDLDRLGLKEQVTDTGVMVSSMAFHLLIRPGSVHIDILDMFDDTIESMRQDGTLSSIEARYQQ